MFDRLRLWWRYRNVPEDDGGGDTFEFIGWDNDVRVAAGLPPRGIDEPPGHLSGDDG